LTALFPGAILESEKDGGEGLRAVFKYDCRKCPIRNRCIDESNNSPSTKTMVRNAFAVRTDTHATWGLLQSTCLLVKADEERTRKSPQEESLLARRLRLIRESKEGISPAPKRSDYLQPVSSTAPRRLTPEEKPAQAQSNPESRRETTSPGHLPPEKPAWATSMGEPRPDVIGAVEALPKVFPNRQKTAANQHKPYWLTISSSNRHIALPVSGELVLGRFDPNLGLAPDVDLAYEDAGSKVVSRRHAKIAGQEGRYTIEDLGSRHGVFLNGEPIKLRPSRPLQAGDQISLGDLRLYYEAVPVERLIITATARSRHVLIAPTGEELVIVPPQDIVIGRSDRYVDFTPDIDLNPLDEIAVRVSRRHAIITWRNDLPHLEDLGSGFGTRLNGEVLLLGQAVQLKAGDHIWLGGCVLAYDVVL
jgi:pSer/pThr/pTyr-binding forkhead associated (FHA) protein